VTATPREVSAVRPATMNDHVNLLGILFITSGGLGLLLALMFLSLAFGAAMLMSAAEPGQRGLAVGFTAAAFGVLAVLASGWAGANIWAGAGLRRHRHAARTLSLLLAVLHLFVLPFGTALGAYGFWVLLNDQARQLFQEPHGTNAS
jgi:hypothetical protein